MSLRLTTSRAEAGRLETDLASELPVTRQAVAKQRASLGAAGLISVERCARRPSGRAAAADDPRYSDDAAGGEQEDACG